MWKIICALFEGLAGLDRLEREMRHWRWTLCFWTGSILAVILFVAGLGSGICEILAGVVFFGMIGFGIWWDW